MARMLGRNVFETLLHEGVDIIFGLPGGYVLKVYDIMPQYTNGRINTSWQGMNRAQRTWRMDTPGASGRPGVVFCTSGPAATGTRYWYCHCSDGFITYCGIFYGQVPTPYA